MASEGKAKVKVEFPILVFRDGDDWVAQSIWTCTTAVSRDHRSALVEVCSLLSAELDAALEDTKGNMEEALRAITCLAPEDVLRKYYSCASRIDPPPSIRADDRGHPTP